MDANLVQKHTTDLGRFLTRGWGQTQLDATAGWYPAHYPGSNFNDYNGGFAYSNNKAMMQYGYYSVHEFTANALYFRRYREKRYSIHGGVSDYGVTQMDGVQLQFSIDGVNRLHDSRKCRALVHLKSEIEAVA